MFALVALPVSYFRSNESITLFPWDDNIDLHWVTCFNKITINYSLTNQLNYLYFSRVNEYVRVFEALNFE